MRKQKRNWEIIIYNISVYQSKINKNQNNDGKAFAHSFRVFRQYSVRSRRANEIRNYWKTFTLFDIDNLSHVFLLLLLLKQLWCEAPKDCSGYISKKKKNKW